MEAAQTQRAITEPQAQARTARALELATSAIELAVRHLNEAGAWADDWAPPNTYGDVEPARELQITADDLAAKINAEASGLIDLRDLLKRWAAS